MPLIHPVFVSKWIFKLTLKRQDRFQTNKKLAIFKSTLIYQFKLIYIKKKSGCIQSPPTNVTTMEKYFFRFFTILNKLERFTQKKKKSVKKRNVKICILTGSRTSYHIFKHILWQISKYQTHTAYWNMCR